MKKGFTLIEIIISISLILLIGLVGVTIFKQDNNFEIEEFNNTLKTSSYVFLEKLKLDKELYQLEKTGDKIYLKISDYIEEGLLKEELIDPHFNCPLKDSAENYVKIFMNENYEVEVEYPVNKDENTLFNLKYIGEENYYVGDAKNSDIVDLIEVYNDENYLIDIDDNEFFSQYEIIFRNKTGGLEDYVYFRKNTEGAYTNSNNILKIGKYNIILKYYDEKTSEWIEIETNNEYDFFVQENVIVIEYIGSERIENTVLNFEEEVIFDAWYQETTTYLDDNDINISIINNINMNLLGTQNIKAEASDEYGNFSELQQEIEIYETQCEIIEYEEEYDCGYWETDYWLDCYDEEIVCYEHMGDEDPQCDSIEICEEEEYSYYVEETCYNTWYEEICE